MKLLKLPFACVVTMAAIDHATAMAHSEGAGEPTAIVCSSFNEHTLEVWSKSDLPTFLSDALADGAWMLLCESGLVVSAPLDSLQSRVRILENWRRQAMTTLQDTQTLVGQLQTLMATINNNQTKIASDFQQLSNDIAQLITDYQNLGGNNQALIDSINATLTTVSGTMGAVATAQVSTDTAITGEDSTVEGITNPPPPAQPAGSSSPAGAASTAAAAPASSTAPQGPLVHE